jgi:hypothetical protein
MIKMMLHLLWDYLQKVKLTKKFQGYYYNPLKMLLFIGILLQPTKNAVYLDLIVSAYATELGITLGPTCG